MSESEPEAGALRDARSRMVVLGRISGVFGVRGWVKVFSHTAPREAILSYTPWSLKTGGVWREHRLLGGKLHGKGVIALIEGCEDRDQAAQWIGRDIAVRRDQLPATGEGEYYWSDLEGLRVRNLEGADLGVVDHLFDTGANDVMVVKGRRERLIPYLWERVVKRVDLEAGEMLVDWDAEF